MLSFTQTFLPGVFQKVSAGPSLKHMLVATHYLGTVVSGLCNHLHLKSLSQADFLFLIPKDKILPCFYQCGRNKAGL